jgi:hypothetical protein
VDEGAGRMERSLHPGDYPPSSGPVDHLLSALTPALRVSDAALRTKKGLELEDLTQAFDFNRSLGPPLVLDPHAKPGPFSSPGARVTRANICALRAEFRCIT